MKCCHEELEKFTDTNQKLEDLFYSCVKCKKVFSAVDIAIIPRSKEFNKLYAIGHIDQ